MNFLLYSMKSDYCFAHRNLNGRKKELDKGTKEDNYEKNRKEQEREAKRRKKEEEKKKRDAKQQQEKNHW